MKTMQQMMAATCCLALLACGAFGQGSLTPPGAPAETMKTLEQIEPRIDVATLAGGGTSHHSISEPGSYYLSGNLEVTLSSGIGISAPGVTLDLNGFEISHASGTGGYGIYVASWKDRATIRNGSIVGFVYGIFTASTEGCLLENLAVSDCAVYGIHAGDGARIVDCRAHGNFGGGIKTGTGSSLSGCTAYGNQGIGISVAAGTSLSGCTASGNQAEYGIFADIGSSLTGCAAHNNATTYAIYAGSGSSLLNCTAYANRGSGSSSYGIYAGLGSVVADCAASNNSNTNSPGSYSQGVGIYANNGSTVRNCAARNNQGDGILLSGDAAATGNTCDGNGNGGDGAGIHTTSTDNRIDGNTVVDNDRGIDVDVTGNIIVRNTASGNTLNWDVAANNACLVVYRTGCTAISGNSGGTAPGSTDPNANYTY